MKQPSYCGICGTPDCVCGQYQEFGAKGATNAGSANTDDETPMKFGGGKEGGKSSSSGEEEGGKAPPFGKKE